MSGLAPSLRSPWFGEARNSATTHESGRNADTSATIRLTIDDGRGRNTATKTLAEKSPRPPWRGMIMSQDRRQDVKTLIERDCGLPEAVTSGTQLGWERPAPVRQIRRRDRFADCLRGTIRMVRMRSGPEPAAR